MLILNWAIESNNMYIWFQTVTQQNNIARCASTNPLAFYNFSLGTDSVKCKYNDSKADKEAKKLSEKNIYANFLISKYIGLPQLVSIVLQKGTS